MTKSSRIVPPYFPTTENARRTLPGMLPRRAYPEFANNIPPATTPTRTVERSTGGAHAIHGLIITNGVEIPNDFSLFSRVSAQVTVKRAGKYDARNRGHCLRLRGTAS